MKQNPSVFLKFISAIHEKSQELLHPLEHNVKQKESIDTLENSDRKAFVYAASIGDVKTIKQLWHNADNKQRVAMLEFDHHKAFVYAALNGHLGVVKQLWCYANEAEKSEMLKAGNYLAFASSAIHGHKEVMQTLWGYANNTQKAVMLEAGNYKAFRLTAINHNVGVIRALWNYASNTQKAAMLCARNYEGFVYNARNGRIEIAQELWNYANDLQKTQMLTALSKHYISERSKFNIDITKAKFNMCSGIYNYLQTNEKGQKYLLEISKSSPELTNSHMIKKMMQAIIPEVFNDYSNLNGGTITIYHPVARQAITLFRVDNPASKATRSHIGQSNNKDGATASRNL